MKWHDTAEFFASANVPVKFENTSAYEQAGRRITRKIGGQKSRDTAHLRSYNDPAAVPLPWGLSGYPLGYLLQLGMAAADDGAGAGTLGGTVVVTQAAPVIATCSIEGK